MDCCVERKVGIVYFSVFVAHLIYLSLISISQKKKDDSQCRSCAGRSSGVDWVQCDGGCNGWFHCHCVNLTKVH